MRSKILLLSLLITTATSAQAAAPIVYNGDKFYGVSGPKLMRDVAHRLQVGSETTYVKADPRPQQPLYGSVAMAAPYGEVSTSEVGESVYDATPDAVNGVQESAYQSGAISSVSITPVSQITTTSTTAPVEQQVASAERSFLPANLFRVRENAAPTPSVEKTGRTAGAIALQSPKLVDKNEAEPVVAKEVSFIKPVFGEVISRFGSKQNGRQNDGINIAAPLGTPIRAAADGKVVYAGNELQGYGNMIIVRHDSGWMSAYAHADSIRVIADQNVRQGDTLGTVGKTGNVETAQLHFGLRKENAPIDPLTKVHTNYAAVR